MSTKWQRGYTAGKTRARQEVAYITLAIGLFSIGWQLLA